MSLFLHIGLGLTAAGTFLSWWGTRLKLEGVRQRLNWLDQEIRDEKVLKRKQFQIVVRRIEHLESSTKEKAC